MKIASSAPIAARTTLASTPATLGSVVNSDPGFKVKTTATSITVSGTAKGPTTIDPSTGKHEPDEYLNTEEVGAGLGFNFDHDKMPNFKFDPVTGYTAKNKWVEAHQSDVSTKAGQKPADVLKALAAKVQQNRQYTAKVVVNADGSATLTVSHK
jgi:uncharacterized protein YcnI